jgi:hypothetical protein
MIKKCYILLFIISFARANASEIEYSFFRKEGSLVVAVDNRIIDNKSLEYFLKQSVVMGFREANISVTDDITAKDLSEILSMFYAHGIKDIKLRFNFESDVEVIMKMKESTVEVLEDEILE